ncbi:MAG: hypothetical protein AB7H97_17805 [Pseudobdellovibrionaceae bacterium]
MLKLKKLILEASDTWSFACFVGHIPTQEIFVPENGSVFSRESAFLQIKKFQLQNTY